MRIRARGADLVLDLDSQMMAAWFSSPAAAGHPGSLGWARTGWKPPAIQLSMQEVEDLREILELGPGPWEVFPGVKDAKAWDETMEFYRVLNRFFLQSKTSQRKKANAPKRHP